MSGNIQIAPARTARLSEIKHPETRAQHMASSAALYTAVGDVACTFTYGENGRPEIADGHVSLAHTSGIAVCAACDCPVGVDIELKDRQLSQQIQKMFPSLDDWLAMEACVKMTGEGLTAMRKYRRDGEKMLDQNGCVEGCLQFFDHGRYRLAICCREEFKIQII